MFMIVRENKNIQYLCAKQKHHASNSKWHLPIISHEHPLFENPHTLLTKNFATNGTTNSSRIVQNSYNFLAIKT